MDIIKKPVDTALRYKQWKVKQMQILYYLVSYSCNKII